MKSLELDISRFIHALEDAVETVADAAKRGMHDALDEWKAESVDVAPIDKSTLRRSIHVGEISGDGANLTGEVVANAIESNKGRRFNYAYYLHEVAPGKGINTRTPGTTLKFLDQPAEKHGDKWLREIEAEIESELKRKGW